MLKNIELLKPKQPLLYIYIYMAYILEIVLSIYVTRYEMLDKTGNYIQCNA